MQFADSYDALDLTNEQLRAYFALMDAVSLLRHNVETQLRETAGLTYAQFKVLARLGLDSHTGSLRMTELADEVVYSRSGLTYQADRMEEIGLIQRSPSPEDDRGVVVTITQAGRDRLAQALPGHIAVLKQLLFHPMRADDPAALANIMEPVLKHMRSTPPRSAAPRRKKRRESGTRSQPKTDGL